MLGFSKCKYTKNFTNRKILQNKTPSDCRHPTARQTCQPLNFIQKKNIPFSGDTELTSQGRSFSVIYPFHIRSFFLCSRAIYDWFLPNLLFVVSLRDAMSEYILSPHCATLVRCYWYSASRGCKNQSYIILEPFPINPNRSLGRLFSYWSVYVMSAFLWASCPRPCLTVALSPLRFRNHPLDVQKTAAKVLDLFLSGSLFYLNPASSFV